MIDKFDYQKNPQKTENIIALFWPEVLYDFCTFDINSKEAEIMHLF